MNRAALTVSSLCALAIAAAACAPVVPVAVDPCRFGEVVGSWRMEPPSRRELVLVIDTHGDLPSRVEVASAAGTIVRTHATGDVDGDEIPETSPVDDDLRIAVIASAPDCGEPPTLIEWLPTESVGGDVASFVMRVERAVRELPTCSSSTPLAATARFLASQEYSGVGPVSIDVAIVTDEDEPGADAASLLALSLPDAYRLGQLSIVSPTPLGLDPVSPDWDTILASPVCIEGAEGSRALLRAAREVQSAGFRVAVGSSCEELWRAPLEASTHHLVGINWCVPGPAALADELADCQLTERLDRTGLHARCADLPGRDPIPIAIDHEGLETCRIIQRPAGDDEPGWSLARHDIWCTEAELEVQFVGIEAEAAALIELRCGSIPVTDQCE